MRKIIPILILFIMVILVDTKIVFALELCEKSDEYKAYEKLSEKEKENVIEPLYCKYDKKQTRLSNNLKSLVRATLTSPYYNANEEGLVTGIKNQYSVGSCWAFSAISLIETNALKNGLPEYDFNEAHMVYGLLQGGYAATDTEGRKGKYASESINAGGKPYFSASYYFNNEGQLLEDEMEYPKYPKTISSSDYPKGRPIITAEKFEIHNTRSHAACSTDEINIMKQKILDSGSVQATMYFDDNLFADSGNNYYLSTNNDSPGANHGVVIVGWDDSISKTKFNGAIRDGAWIVKNSYGETWSGDGYFYISYDDNFVCQYVVSYSGVSNTTFENTYKSSDLISFTAGFNINGLLYVSSKFEKQTQNKENIQRVSFAVGSNLSYSVYLSKNNIKTDMSDWILLGSGYSDSLSVRSVNIDTEVVDGDFTIIIKYDSDSGVVGNVPTMCNNDEDVAHLEYSSLKNYIKTSSSSWVDMYNIPTDEGNVKCEPIIYTYTNKSSDEESGQNSQDDITIVNNTSASINDVIITFAIAKENTLTTNNITDYITINHDYSIVDGNDVTISGNIGTGSRIKIDDKYYPIVILGDVTGDGRVNSGDLLRVVKYLKGISTLDDYQYKAGDTTKDNNINSGDLLRLVKYLKGTVSFTV